MIRFSLVSVPRPVPVAPTTDAEVIRMREVHFAGRLGISDLGIRIILEMLPPALAGELRQELVRPDPAHVTIDNIFRRVPG
jgi:hypothetical protein